jgi:hypothetical protein
VRKNNEWLLDPNQKEIEQEQKSGISDSNILCNLQEKCISVPEKIGDKCESIEISKMDLQQNVLKDIINEFDQKYYETKTEFEEKINKKYTYLFEILRIVNKIENDNMLKYNNQRYKITNIDTFRITIQDDFKKLYEIGIPDFQKFFLPGYATTTHSAQGMSIGEPYTIHEWDRMDQRLKYVALSRSRSIEYINIMK